jgi:acyl-coenzyme A synthetase/AMP-(fatty) acid ligase
LAFLGQCESGKILYHNPADGCEAKIAAFCRDRSWTYKELINLTSSAANGPCDIGIERENRVALLLDDGPELIAAFYGAMSIGAIPIVLNTASRAANYELLLNRSRAKALVVVANLFQLVDPILSHCPSLRHVIRVAEGSESRGILQWRNCIADNPTELTPVEVSPDDTAFWLYSSGSTGEPKGVIHLHRAIPYICEHFGQQMLGLTEADVSLSSTKLYHAYGLANSMCYHFSSGGAIVLWDRPSAPAAMFELIEDFRVTVFFLLPLCLPGCWRCLEHAEASCITGTFLDVTGGK